MSQLTIKLSAKADALIAQLQKEIFNRRRKKVSAAGVIETLVESGAKSQSDKRFATSWKNLIADIEKAAKVANAHGSKPANLTDAEWAMVLSHRSRSASTKAPAKAAAQAAPRQPAATKAKSVAKPAAKNPVKKRAVKAASAKPAAKPAAAKKPAAKRTVAKKPSVPATGGSSVAKRMAKAMSRLASPAAAAAPSSNGTGVLTGVS